MSVDIELRAIDDVLPASLFGLQPPAVKLARGVPDLAALKTLVHTSETNPLAIADAMDTATQKEWRGWDPVSLWDYLETPEDDIAQKDKILAVQVALTNPDVFEDWQLFSHVNSAFNHRRCDFEWLQECSPLELAWTCSCLRALSRNQFGPDVLRYIGAVCAEDGTTYFPWTGGDGILFCEDPYREWFRGLVDPVNCEIASRVREHWKSGALAELAPSTVNESDPFHVQMAKVVAAQSYIRAQRQRDPGDQGAVV